LRVDANGGFTKQEAKTVLKQLNELDIHSIEQPIKAGSWSDMAELCLETPTPIALDEELIGIIDRDKKMDLLDTVQPQYIILKPSLVGGFSGSDEWISLAEERNIGWWITSALESNIGLNAIAQYTFTKKNPMPQGLGTGSLFVNNFDSNLDLKGELLYFKK
jgi:L-alanine-DL-glutamate epimerase-like enolase superfamily enzyme